jgi:hypothetical protein
MLECDSNPTTSNTRMQRFMSVWLQKGYGLVNGFTDHYINHLKLQVITAPLLIYTIHRSSQHPLCLFSACCVFNSRSLAMASNSGDFSASSAHVVTVRWISHYCQLTIVISLLSVPCRALLNCQPSTEVVNLIVFKITPQCGPHWKHHSSIVAHVFVSVGTCLPSRCLETGCITKLFYCCMRVCCWRYLAMTAIYRVTA